jgi:Fur family ferric uptake transcriptional regulator
MKHHHDHNFESTLHSKGLKSTPLRLAIMDILSQTEGPLTAEEIAKKLKTVSFDRATLFRSLKTFTTNSLINAIDLGEGFSRYELNCDLHHHHHHIICTSCKEIDVVPFCIPDEFKNFLLRKGYKNVTHRMDFSGICKDCAGKSSK